MRLKKVSLVIVSIVCLAYSLTALTPVTRARIEEKGSDWMLDKGTSSGVKEGVEGYLMKKSYSATDKKMINVKIAHFKIFRVFKYFSYARVDRWQEGFSAKDAQWAEFASSLSSPQSTKKKKTPKKEKVVEAGKSRRWYLDKGDAAYDLAKFDQALNYFYKVLEIDPQDPGARLRVKSAKARYFLQQGDLDYKKNEFPSAYEYYIMAFQILERNDYLAAEKIVDLWTKDAGLYDKIQDYDIKPEHLLDSLLKYCQQLLTEGQMDKLSALAAKMYDYAPDETIKNQLNTLMSAKDIQVEIKAGNFSKLVIDVDNALQENNLYKANYIIRQLKNTITDDTTLSKIKELENKMDSMRTQRQIDQALHQKHEQIKKLENEAQAFIAIKKYGEAIDRYLEMYKLEPEKTEYSDKIKELQLEKFKYEKFQQQIKARVEVDNLVLHAEDRFRQELMQDALDYYIKAYKILPEEGKAVKGIVKVLEKCSADDAAFITTERLDRKLSKFIKDFLSFIEKEYLGKDDDMGFVVLNRISFITHNKDFDQLVLKFKANLYEKNLQLANAKFKAADFKQASQFYSKARDMKETELSVRRINVCQELVRLKEWSHSDRKKEINQYLDGITMRDDKYDILEGTLNLCDSYLDSDEFKKAKFLYKKVAGFQIYKFRKIIDQLKKKEKELKRKK